MDSKAFRKLSYGVYLLTTKDQKGKRIGCIINSAFQVTSSPARILVSLSHENDTCRAVKESGKMILSVLGEDADMEVISVFGYHSSRDMDKFASFQAEEMDGLPYLPVGLADFELEVESVQETESHTLFLTKVLDASVRKEGKEMTYSYFHAVKKGVSPKNAPTYQETEQKKNGKHHFRCTVCGYVYETEEEELPDAFVCPLCGVGKEMFEKID